MNIAASLHDLVAAICPIDGVSIGDPADKATWRIDFASSATEAQKASAQTALANFDVASFDAARSVGASALAAIAAGCDLRSTGTPALDGVYDIAGAAWQDMRDEAQYISTFGAFSGGQTQLSFTLLDGRSTVTFTSTAQFLAVARALGDYVTAVKLAAQQPSWTAPTQPKVIA